MTYFIKNEQIEEVPCMSLFYDFRVALENEDYNMCQKIKDEFDRRDKLNEVDKEFMKYLLDFYNKYSDEDISFSKEHFNEVFNKYI